QTRRILRLVRGPAPPEPPGAGSATVCRCQVMLGLPGSTGLDHGVENGQKFPHGCDESNLLGFAGCTEAIVKGLDIGIVTSSDKGGHVENGADLGSSAPHGSSSAEGAAVPVEGSDSYQGGDFSSRQSAELRKVGQ